MQGKLVLELKKTSGKLAVQIRQMKAEGINTVTPFFEDVPRRWLADQSEWRITVEGIGTEAKAEMCLGMQEASAES